MSLTIGTGPFGPNSAGEFNREMPSPKGLLYLDAFPRRMRAIFAGQTVVDSRHAKLLHEHGHLAVLYFPGDEVRTDLLEPTDHSTRCPWKGDAAYWSVRVDDRVAENAVWGYPEPVEGAQPLAGYLAVYWNEMDEWLEEDEPARVHVRDPYHRVDILDSSRHVRVSLNGELLAETEHARVLYETGLPPRWYMPADDVRTDLLVDSDTRARAARTRGSPHTSRCARRARKGKTLSGTTPSRRTTPSACVTSSASGTSGPTLRSWSPRSRTGTGATGRARPDRAASPTPDRGRRLSG